MPTGPDGLTDRELEVLRLLAAGLSNQEIGAHLHISGNTAANHVRSILHEDRGRQPHPGGHLRRTAPAGVSPGHTHSQV